MQGRETQTERERERERDRDRDRESAATHAEELEEAPGTEGNEADGAEMDLVEEEPPEPGRGSERTTGERLKTKHELY